MGSVLNEVINFQDLEQWNFTLIKLIAITGEHYFNYVIIMDRETLVVGSSLTLTRPFSFLSFTQTLLQINNGLYLDREELKLSLFIKLANNKKGRQVKNTLL